MRKIACPLMFLAFTLGASQLHAATFTLNPGDNITAKIEFANTGDTLELNPGIYTAQNTTQYVDGNLSIGIGKKINIVGKGAVPGDVILRGASTSVYTVSFTQYTMPQPGGVAGAGLTNLTPSGSLLQNLTIDSGRGGLSVFNPNIRFTDITLKDVVISTKLDGDTFGVLLQNADRIVVDNVSVTSNQSGLYLVNVTDSLVMNSTVTGTGSNASGTDVGAASLAVIGGTGNRFVGNTFGSAKASPATDSGYSVNTGNVVFYNSTANRFEGNLVQGHRDDGLDFSALINPSNVGTVKSTDNYAGKNTVISTGYAAGRLHGSGIWANCGADNTWLYANESRGSAECGVCVWTSKSNMVMANLLSDNRLTGVFVSGGAEAPPLCPVPAFANKPTNVFVRNNNIFYNQNDQVVVRNASDSDLSLNFISPRNGFGGALQTCNPSNSFCQAAISLETDSTATSSSGFAVAGNISHENNRGLWSDDGKATGVQFFGNRIMGSTLNRFVQSSALNLDAGSALGGNYWTQHTAFGNPSSANPYSGIFQDTSNNTGLVSDRYPYQNEDLGRGYSVTVYEPRAGLQVAQGSSRTVRWVAPGCTYVDVSLNGANLSTNLPNTGYAVVAIPVSATLGTSKITVQCKTSVGVNLGTGDSSVFNVTSSNLKLLSPGRDDVFSSGDSIYVAWKKAASISSVTVELSIDGGVTYSVLPITAGGTGNFARVTIPLGTASTAYGVIRISSGSNVDTTDGVFAIRGSTGAGIVNVASTRKFVAGLPERLEWASPVGSRLVTIVATAGSSTKTVAADLPDRGHFDWIVPDFANSGLFDTPPAVGGNSTLSLSITFKSSGGTTLGSTGLSAAGSVVYPTTITFGATPAIGPGNSATISATTNSGAGVTFSSRTPAVCTISGNTTVSGQVAGTCTIDANATGDSTHAVASPGTLSFTVGSTQTVAFKGPTLVTVNGTTSLTASATSGLTVTFRSLTGATCGVSGAIVSGLSAGTCTVEASQAGNSSFSAATPVLQSFPVMVNTDIPRLVNIATRANVQTGDNVMIAGFIIGGEKKKQVLIRARGPSLAAAPFNVPGTLSDPTMTLYSGATPIDSNDDFANHANASSIPESYRPTNAKESAILATLNPGAYTAIVSGVGQTSGVAIVEAFEMDLPEVPLINIATRANVQSGDNVMIAGLIIQGNAPKTVLIRARGPSLAAFGVAGTMSDPYLRIYSGASVIHENDDWGSNANAGAITATGNAPTDAKEAAVLVTLPPGAYTAIVSGVNGSAGVGIVEVFAQ
jgi:hypothetical protein